MRSSQAVFCFNWWFQRPLPWIGVDCPWGSFYSSLDTIALAEINSYFQPGEMISDSFWSKNHSHVVPSNNTTHAADLRNPSKVWKCFWSLSVGHSKLLVARTSKQQSKLGMKVVPQRKHWKYIVLFFTIALLQICDTQLLRPPLNNASNKALVRTPSSGWKYLAIDTLGAGKTHEKILLWISFQFRE